MSVSKSFAKKLAVLASFGLAATLLGGEHAEAAAATTTTLGVSVVVDSKCQISTGASVAFNPYDPATIGDTDTASGGGTSGRLDVNCTTGIPFTLAFGAGTGTPTTRLRAMVNGASMLNYELQLSGSATQIAVGAATVSASGDGFTTDGSGLQSYVVDGVIPAGQGVPAGNYTDTVIVTMAY